MPPVDRSRLRPGAIIYADELKFHAQIWGMLYMPDRDPLLQERQKTHGDFKNNAYISQHLKAFFKQTQAGYNDALSNDVHREALDMIALKLSRILSGQANFKDHWDDIAGYAKLGSEACE